MKDISLSLAFLAGILSSKALTTTIPKTIRCVFHKKRFEKLKLPDALIKDIGKSGGYLNGITGRVATFGFQRNNQQEEKGIY